MALFSWRRKVILLKIESAYGTDPTPVFGTDGILAMNLSISLEADKLEREIDRSFFAANPFVLVGRRCMVEFDFEPMGHATPGTAAPCGPLLRACAHAQVLVPATSATYNPITATPESATLYYWMGNQRFAITGCRGTIDFDHSIKQFPKAHAKLTGLFAIPTNTAIVTPTLTAWQDPPAIETETWELSVDGSAVNAVSFTLSQNNETPIHEGSEAREVVLTDRKAGGVLRVYDPGVSVFDFWTLAKDHTKVPIVSTVTGGAGLIQEITVGLAQFELPKFVEIDGVVGLEIPYVALASSAGSDEYTLALT